MNRGRGKCLVAVGLLTASCDGGGTMAGPTPPADAPGALARVHLTPVVAATGEAFLVEFVLEKVAADSVEVELFLQAGRDLLLDGTPLSTLGRFGVYDDGSHGDRTAGDGTFSRDGLTLPVGPHGLESAFFDQAWFVGTGISFLENVQLTFRSIDIDVAGLPPHSIVAPDFATTPHASFLTHPLAVDLDSVRPLTRAYYAHLPDDRDVLMVLRAAPHVASNSGTAYLVEPWAEGIGQGPRLHDPSWGSERRLHAVVDLKRAIWVRGENPEGAFCLAIHELTHQWAAFTGPPLADRSGHWNDSVLARDDSGLGMDGVCRFNDLEMYLAGWLTPDSIIAPLSAEGLMIEDLIADLGQRFPSEGQERLALGLLVATEQALSPTEMAYFDRIIREFSAPTTALGGLTWMEATHGRSTLDPALPPAALGRIGPSDRAR